MPNVYPAADAQIDHILLMLDNSRGTLETCINFCRSWWNDNQLGKHIEEYCNGPAQRELRKETGGKVCAKELGNALAKMRATLSPEEQTAYWTEVAEHYRQKFVESLPVQAGKFKSITIVGREWFRKSCGNSYQTAEIVIDGHSIGKTTRECSYGEHYVWTAFEMLRGFRLIAWPGNSRGTFGDAPWHYCEKIGVTLNYRKINVSREKDL